MSTETTKTYDVGIGDAARRIGISPWTLRKWARDGRIEAVQHPDSHRWVFNTGDVDRANPHAVTVTIKQEP